MIKMADNNFGRPNEMEGIFTSLPVEQQEDITKFITHLQVNKYSPRTTSQYRFYLIHFHNFVNKRYIDMNKDDIDKFTAKMSTKGMNNELVQGISMRMIFSLLNSYFSFYNRNELRLNRRTMKQKKSDEREIFSVEEREKFFSMAEELYGIKIRAFMEFTFWEGLRISEAINMELNNIDFLRNKVHVVSGKGNKDATIDLLPKAKEVLEKYMGSEYFKKNQKYLFEYDYTKGKLAGKRDKYYVMLIETIFQRILGKMNMGKFLTFHCLRHSCGSHLLAALGEAGLPYVRKHMRHEIGSPVTLRYLHTLDKAITPEQLNKIGGI